MSVESFVFIRINLLEKRFQEIETLLEQAVNNVDSPLYRVLCRSAHILLVSHFEGFIKDIVKDVLEDVNANSSFKEAPVVVKRTFCEYYQKKNDNGEYDEKIKNKLVEVFDELPVKFKVNPFLPEMNRNPSAEMLQQVLTKFGIKDFILTLKDSELYTVFENNRSDTLALRDRLKKSVLDGTKNFPYTVNSAIYKPLAINGATSRKKTLWDTFVEELLANRHKIVHGEILENPTDHDEIENSLLKVEILLYAFVINLCQSIKITQVKS
jgi:hypothetical protein